MSAPTLDPAMTRGDAQRLLARAFAEAGVESPALDARLLLCAACGIRHVALISDPDAPLGGAAETLASHAARRIAGEPVSRILGEREFWGLAFEVTPDVLDPRPDTETIVEAALGALGEKRREPIRILDLGTGSGAILAALLSECPFAFGVAVDRSEAAARVAQRNFRRLGFAGRAVVALGDWGAALAGRFDVIVSNPPYIPEGDLAGLDREVRLHDPALALSGGADGFDSYRIVVADAARLLKPGGAVVIEAGVGQAEGIAGLLAQSGFVSCELHKDFGGIDRAVLARRPG